MADEREPSPEIVEPELSEGEVSDDEVSEDEQDIVDLPAREAMSLLSDPLLDGLGGGALGGSNPLGGT